MNLEFFVSKRRLTRKGLCALAADTAACDTFTIDFDREWDGLVKIVVLQNGENVVQLLYTGKTPLPRQVCGTGALYLTCHGYRQKGDTVAVVRTLPMVRPVLFAGAAAPEQTTSQPEAASVFAQMTALVVRAESAAAQMKLLHDQLRLQLEQGKLKGEPGPAGEAASITLAPVRTGDVPMVENLGTARNACLRFTLPGKYVLTQEDRQKIAEAVDELLAQLIGSGVLT